MIEIFTAFEGLRRLASGPLADAPLAVRRAEPQASEPIAIFSDSTGRAVDLDLRGNANKIVAWLSEASAASPAEETAPRGRGRPKLGVVAREVTLLPRHWEWLAAQPGGASVALRKLGDAPRRADDGATRRNARQEAAYRFRASMAGDLPGYEEALRALFAGDRTVFDAQVAAWPGDLA